MQKEKAPREGLLIVAEGDWSGLAPPLGLETSQPTPRKPTFFPACRLRKIASKISNSVLDGLSRKF